MEAVTDTLGRVLDVVLVYDVRGVCLLWTNDLACDLVIVAVKSLSEHLTTNRVKLGHEMCGKKPEVVFFQYYGACLLYLKCC